MSTSDGGKGSSPRPFSVSNEEYAKRWEAIFGRDQVDKIIEDAEKYLANEALNKKADNSKELGLDYD